MKNFHKIYMRLSSKKKKKKKGLLKCCRSLHEGRE